MKITQNSLIKHHGKAITEDEELTPMVENIIVLAWLKLLHPDLPKRVKQRYGVQLRSQTLASIKPEISQALDYLLEEISTCQDMKSMSTSTKSNQQRRSSTSTKSNRKCILCDQAGRPSKHWLSECRYLPDHDKKFMARLR